MAVANPVTLAQIDARFPGRVLTEAEQINATAWLADVWSMVLSRRPNIEAQMTPTYPVPDGGVATSNVIRVVTNSVIRRLLNPEGKSEESIDDYRYKRDVAVSSGELYLTEDELADITPGYGGATRGSVRLVAYGDT